MEFNLTHIMGAYKLKYNIIGYLENVYLVSNMFLHTLLQNVPCITYASVFIVSFDTVHPSLK